MTKQVFVYGGYHFTPYRTFNQNEHKAKFVTFSKHLRSNSLGITNYRGKRLYSIDDFYKASNDSVCDIFRCVEDGKLYIPGENELFEYNEM